MSDEPFDDLLDASRDLAYIGVGLGVLVFQKLQVQRRSLDRAFAAESSSLVTAVCDSLRTTIRDCR